MRQARTNNRYHRDEQLRILKEIQSGQIDIKSAARKYGVSPSGINYWKIHFGMRGPQGRLEKARFFGEEVDQIQKDQHIEQLKLKVAELYMENEFLKKVRASTARQKKLNASIITDQNHSAFRKRVR
jgi:transposase-like protein